MKEENDKNENDDSKLENVKINNSNNNNLGNTINYINQDFYNKFINMETIRKDDKDIINIIGDGNCFLRYISVFVYKDEEQHLRVRNEIPNYLLANWNKI